MPVLYGVIASPPCRAVLMTGKALGVDLEMNVVNIREGENRTPEFLEVVMIATEISTRGR